MPGTRLLTLHTVLYIKSECIAVARAGEVPLPQAMDTNVIVMTTKSEVEVLAGMSHEDYVLPEDKHFKHISVKSGGSLEVASV